MVNATDRAMVAIGLAIAALVALIAGSLAYRWWSRPTAVRRRSAGRDVRVLERAQRGGTR